MEPSVSFLTRVAARSEKLPLLLTIARKRPANICANVFGKRLTACFILDSQNHIQIVSANAGAALAEILLHGGTLMDAAKILRRADRFHLMLRFTESRTAKKIFEKHPAFCQTAKVILIDKALPHEDAGLLRALLPAPWRYHQVANSAGQPIAAWHRGELGNPKDAAPLTLQTVPMQTLAIVDNSLTGERGHNLSVARNITQGARDLGIRVVWAANRRLTQSAPPDGVTLEPCFTRANYDVQGLEDVQADLSAEIAAGWQQLIERYDGRQTHYLIHSATGHHFRAVQHLLANTPIQGVIHLCTFYETSKMPARLLAREIDREIYLLTRHPLFGQRSFLWTETDVLARLYTEHFNADIRVLPLPIPDWACCASRGNTAAPLKTVFLGAARREKGFLELPHIVSAVLNDPDAAAQVQFTVQAAPPIKGVSVEIAAALKALHGLPGVGIVPHALDDDDYRRLLLQSDVVLLPYRRQNYAARGSGILIEALACGKVCLVSGDTALAHYDNAAPILSCNTPSDWLEAIQKVLKDREAYRLRAAEYAARFRARQNSTAYIQRLIAPIGG